jgi:protein-tyrosine phosphatase
MNEIIPNLYLSNWNSSNNIHELKNNNIKAVITIETSPKPEYILKYYKDNNIDFLYLPLNDYPSENIYKYFDSSYNFIKKHINKGENVLVHCRMGISRSATLVLNYIYKNNINTFPNNNCVSCTVKNIISYIRTKRPIVNPNPGFIQQVIQYYN